MGAQPIRTLRATIIPSRIRRAFRSRHRSLRHRRVPSALPRSSRCTSRCVWVGGTSRSSAWCASPQRGDLCASEERRRRHSRPDVLRDWQQQVCGAEPWIVGAGGPMAHFGACHRCRCQVCTRNLLWRSAADRFITCPVCVSGACASEASATMSHTDRKGSFVCMSE